MVPLRLQDGGGVLREEETHPRLLGKPKDQGFLVPPAWESVQAAPTRSLPTPRAILTKIPTTRIGVPSCALRSGVARRTPGRASSATQDRSARGRAHGPRSLPGARGRQELGRPLPVVLLCAAERLPGDPESAPWRGAREGAWGVDHGLSSRDHPVPSAAPSRRGDAP